MGLQSTTRDPEIRLPIEASSPKRSFACLQPTGAFISPTDFAPLENQVAVSFFGSLEDTRRLGGTQDVLAPVWEQQREDTQHHHDSSYYDYYPTRTTTDLLTLPLNTLSSTSAPPRSPPDVESSVALATAGPHEYDNTTSHKGNRSRTVSISSPPSTFQCVRGSSVASEIRRRKNRLAATKCRRRKKAEERMLEDRKHILHMQRSILQETAKDLANEVFMLKNEVLRHASCNFAPLDNYISHEAGRRL